MSLAILFYFLCAQHVSDINISIIRSLRLCCWITTSVVLFSVRCVLKIWCGWVWVISVLQAEAQLQPQTLKTVQYLTDRDVPPLPTYYIKYYVTVMNCQVWKSTGNFTIHGGGWKRELERKTACSHLPTLPNNSNMRPFTTSSTTSISQGDDKCTGKCTQDCRETAVPYHPGNFLRGKGKNGKVVPVHTRKAHSGVEVQVHPF